MECRTFSSVRTFIKYRHVLLFTISSLFLDSTVSPLR